MGLDVRIEGSAELKRLAAQIRTRGDVGLGREMAAGLKKASQPVQASIRVEYGHLPARGGHAGLFSKSLRFRTTVRGAARQASFRLLTFADGAHQRRDINKLEDGQLRHPVYGRSRPRRGGGKRHTNPWAVTKVTGGYHKRGTDKAADQAEKEMSTVLAEFASKLIE